MEKKKTFYRFIVRKKRRENVGSLVRDLEARDMGKAK